jgi:hypothetical protein
MSASAQITTGTGAAVTLNPLGAGKELRNATPKSGGTLVLRNADATNSVAIGPVGVTAGTGYRMLPLQVLVFTNIERIDLFAIAVAGTPVVDVLIT